MALDYNIIGERLKKARVEKNMTQEKLAELTDVSIALIGNLESEKINQGISVFTLWKISKALEIPIENLFNGLDSKNNSLHA